MIFSLKKTAVVSFISAVLLSNSSAFALPINDPINTLEKPIKASQLVKGTLIKKLASLEYFTADFKQQVLDAEGNELQNALGTLAVKKPNLVHWNTVEPDETLIVSDGVTLWFFDPFVEQVSAYLLEKALMNTPILLLTSSDPTLWQHYSVSSTDENNYLIHAIDNNAQVKTLELRFKENSHKLDSFTILDATGQLSIFKLSQFDDKHSPDSALFIYEIPEGVQLDDQR
ncbi:MULTISPECIES: outer membrane lipoprotein chaperone LolA [unclassified Colwellia]|uniref:outer membrane lipoprotein chaperone LolA n=1 Tax=unclassified Colwellia TaxID=196834 RepID=UPI0015F3FBA8|nr:MULTISPECIES: outer membrane lipoprotein chaperone LolA [unclassified Colwellia]MBA6232884.1 outer membrane lipoprotein chaperone LolA [Colwellia sp. MB02u-7]MBA6237018.1 outer membrane lipoprotein chaperone LolA [Colwellia sp. MB02u-11]MBA6258196.1 outer membrane lipoprotein chaperone LolA [Colwellia sp. MB3u-28]MBA6259623.1 outer membrane lipoprotein chaperone LolA [Colwellia sp. MB3u-41]MBA6299503.1 outer membrane lipoprotein chaperone LolA [Colwellia sp. MB3u-22]